VGLEPNERARAVDPPKVEQDAKDLIGCRCERVKGLLHHFYYFKIIAHTHFNCKCYVAALQCRVHVCGCVITPHRRMIGAGAGRGAGTGCRL
jgi:hypothetical protein